MRIHFVDENGRAGRQSVLLCPHGSLVQHRPVIRTQDAREADFWLISVDHWRVRPYNFDLVNHEPLILGDLELRYGHYEA